MEKYSWDFNKNAELWCNDSFDTISECLKDARENAIEDKRFEEISLVPVYIGENIPFTINLDAVAVLEELEQQAYDFAGDAADGWNACDCKKQDELDELSASLSQVVSAWLKKYGYEPRFYSIENVKKYNIAKDTEMEAGE